MDLQKARDFTHTHHRAVLATRSPTGGIQQSPVLVGLDDDGWLTVSSRETAYKTSNVRSDPWAQVLILSDTFFGSWIYVEGVAHVQSLPEAMEGLVGYYRSVAGEHDDWDAYRESMEKDKRVLIRIEPTRAGPDHQG